MTHILADYLYGMTHILADYLYGMTHILADYVYGMTHILADYLYGMTHETQDKKNTLMINRIVQLSFHNYLCFCVNCSLFGISLWFIFLYNIGYKCIILS
jgi:hypothetical protein